MIHKKNDINKINKDFLKFKSIIFKYVKQKKYEKALRTIFFAAGYMYTLNQKFYDDDLEEIIKLIGNDLIGSVNIKKSVSNTVVFYDGFGNINRGIANNYLKALSSQNYVIKYVSVTPDFDETEQYNINQKVYLNKKSVVENIEILANWINVWNPERIFIYMNPDDIVAASVFSNCHGDCIKYLINLTDHAFWIGKKSFDYIINFRNFGADLCLLQRGIEKKQILYIPYYPVVNKVKFEGLPDYIIENKFIFSGGSIYKTESKDNLYYIMVDFILNKYRDINFVYLGKGNTKKFDALKRKYPNRIYIGTERNDFVEILDRCIFYLSTYPYNGGMMTQYAISKNKIPITLMNDSIDSELSIHNEISFWNFESLEECVEEIDKCIKDERYRKEKEALLNKFYINEEQFNTEFDFIMKNNYSLREIKEENIQYSGFQILPMESYKGFKYCRLFYRKKGYYLIRFFPIKYLLGMINMLTSKI